MTKPTAQLCISLLALGFPFISYANKDCSFDPLNTQYCIDSPPPPWVRHFYSQCFNKKEPLYIDDFVSLALYFNPDTRNSWANVMASAAGLGSALSTYFPQVNVEADYTGSFIFSNVRSTSSAGSAALIPDASGRGGASVTNVLDAGATLSYLIYDFGGREASVAVARFSLMASDWAYNAILQTTIFSTVSAYYNYIASKALVVVADETIASTKASLDAANLRYEVGSAPLLDVLQSQTSYAQAKLQKIQAEAQEAINKGTLLNVVGFEADADIDIGEKPIDINEIYDPFSLNVHSLIECAKNYRPDLMSADYQLSSKKAAIKVAEAKDYPIIELNSAYRFTHQLSGSRATAGNQSSAILQISVALPIFTGFNNYYQIKLAKENYNAQLALYNKTELGVTFDLWQSYQNFVAAYQSVKTTEELLKTAEEADRVARGRYQEGAGTILDLLLAQSQLASARQQYIQAQYTWLTDRMSLIRSLGLLTQQRTQDIQSAVAQKPSPIPRK